MAWETVAGAADHLRTVPCIREFGAALAGFWSLVLPTSCVGCGRADASMCAPCAEAFRRATVRPFFAEANALALPEHLDLPGAPALPGSPARSEPLTRPDGGPGEGAGFIPLPVIAAGSYTGVVARSVLAYKNHNHTDVQRPLAAALGGALHHARSALGLPDGSPFFLVPVPARASSRRRRGYDPLGMLVAGLSRRGELPAGAIVLRAVVFRRGTAPDRAALAGVLGRGRSGGQKGLGRRARRTSTAGTMAVSRRHARSLAGSPCIVVDDVLTTGSTIAEVVRVLRSNGARVAGGVIVAATPPPGATDRLKANFEEIGVGRDE